jgi:subtilisin family serine protease
VAAAGRSEGFECRGVAEFRRNRRRRFRLAHRSDIAVFAGGAADKGKEDRVGYLYRPHEVIVRREDADRAIGFFDKAGVAVRERCESPALDVVRFRMAPGTSVPDLVHRFRAEPSAPPVAPHYVLTGEPVYQGGPAGFPTPDDEPVGFDGDRGAGVRVAVLDTGYRPRVHRFLDRHCTFGPNDEDALDVAPPDGYLDDEAGHGLFVAGVALQLAPGATVAIAKVLDSEGYGSELDIANAIVAHADAAVINMSLGGYADGDIAPIALGQALTRVGPGTAVIAAAGNNASPRKMWPAAFENVFAVGAVNKNGRTRARFSNFGEWVDACTVGVDVHSTFVRFEENPRDSSSERTPAEFDGFAVWSGTSFAAPQLAGAVAARVEPGRSAREAAEQLVDAGTPVADLGRFVELDL